MVGDVFVFGFTGDDLGDVDDLRGELVKDLVRVVKWRFVVKDSFSIKCESVDCGLDDRRRDEFLRRLESVAGDDLRFIIRHDLNRRRFSSSVDCDDVELLLLAIVDVDVVFAFDRVFIINIKFQDLRPKK